MSWLGSMASAVGSSPVVIIVPSFLLCTAITLALDPLRALVGLTGYFAPAPAEAVDAALGGSGAKRARSRGKGGSKKDDDYDLGGAESLVVGKLQYPLVAALVYRPQYENLAIVSVFALGSLALAQASEYLLGWSASLVPPMAAFGAAFVSLAMLAKVDLASASTSPSNKAIAAVWGVLGFSAALALHVLQPGPGRIFAWDLHRAAAAFGPSVHLGIEAFAGHVLRGRGLPAEAATANIPPLEITDSALHVMLALSAAILAVLLFSPAQRFVRAYFLQLRPPEWAPDHITPKPLATLGLTLHFVLPALSALLWVRPMSQDLLQLSDRELAVAQAAALLLAAVVMAANLRTLAQRYLDRGLTGWHQLKHGSKAARGTREQKQGLGELIRMHCQVTRNLLGKVAVQSVGPAILYLGLGLLALNLVLHPVEPGSKAEDAQVLAQSCLGFLSFWTGACWFLYSAVMLWMFRTGVLQP